MKGYKLDSDRTQIVPITLESADELDDILGGIPRIAYRFDFRNILLLNSQADPETDSLIIIPGAPDRYFGVGVVIGFDDSLMTIKDVTIPLTALKKKVVLLSRLLSLAP